jgi:hypothetical protein
MTTQATDIWNDVDNPQVRTGGEYFGQVKIDTYYCTLVKGTGKVPFDAGQHSIDQRRTAIDINIFPIAEQNISFDVSRNMIAESREWAGIVLPSIKNLGISARDLNGKWALVRTKGTGATYTDRNGETRERTTFEFVAVYSDEAACRAAYQLAGNGSAAPASAAPSTPATNGNGSKEKETAAKFLKPIVDNAVKGQTDLEVIRGTVAANISQFPQLAKFFTVDSPEVGQLILEAMAK